MELILVAHTLFQEWRKMVIQWLNLALSGQGSRSVCGQGTKIPQAMQRSQKIIVIIFKEFLLKKTEKDSKCKVLASIVNGSSYTAVSTVCHYHCELSPRKDYR